MKQLTPGRAILAACAAACAAAAGLAACGSDGESSSPPVTPPTPVAEFSAEIRRTEFGVPHVKASNEKGLGYGIGYVFAEDNSCLLADVMVTVNGERSKYFGPEGHYDPSGGGNQANLSSDFYYKYINEPALVQASWDRQPADIKDLMQGYVAGFNRYLKDVGAAGLPAACKSQPWVRDLNVMDMVRLMRRYAVEASGAQFIDALYAAQPPGPAASTQSVHKLSSGSTPGYTPQPAAYWKRYKGGLGSNGVALGKGATESGAGLLLANPHFPWVTALRFYQMHLTIPGKVDVMGASLSGFPAVNIGFNQNVAWTHTVNTSTHFTLFYLQLDPTDPTRYLVDGQSKAMSKKEYSVEVAGPGGGAAQTVKRTYYFTDYGPLATMPGTLDWTRQAAFAFRDANLDNDRMLQQWWAMDKARSMDEFKSAVETVLGIPWVHAIATDKPGNAYYGDITPVPNVSAAKEAACIGAPFKPLVGRGIYVLAGNTAACNWDEDAGTPQKGIFAAAKLPSLMRSDYVQNSNDSAWMTHPAQRLTGFPSIASGDSDELGGRTRIGLSQIAARLAGTDGLAGNKFSMASLQSIAFSNRAYYAGVLLDDLKAACAGGGTVTLDDGSSVDIAKGCNVLSGWDGKAELTSVGWPLFVTWRQAMNDSGVAYWTAPFDAADPVNTPRGLRVADADVKAAARQALGQAMRSLDGQGMDYTKPWGQLQVAVRGTKRIPIHGGAGNEIYNAIYSEPIGDGQFNTNFGSSTIWTISFDGDTPKAQGFLSYSQSTNSASPYYADQTERFSAKNWITFPFTDAAIAADPKLTTKSISQ